ncbi:unnamed protein product, partial [Brassica rapa subsp. trilocularis]
VPLPCLGRFLLASSPATAFQVCFRGVSSRRITVETGSPALGCSVSVLFALDPGSSRSSSLVLSDWPFWSRHSQFTVALGVVSGFKRRFLPWLCSDSSGFS